MIETLTRPNQDADERYPHQVSEDVSMDDLRRHYTDYPEKYHEGLQPHVERHLGSQEQATDNLEVDKAFTGQMTDLLDHDVSGWISEEQISESLAQLRNEQGELRPGSGKAILDVTKGIWTRGGVVPGKFYSALSEHPDLIISTVEHAGSEGASDWDSVAARRTAEESAAQLNSWRTAQELMGSNSWWSAEPQEKQALTTEQEAVAAEKERVAAQFMEVAAVLPESPVKDTTYNNSTGGIFARYGALEQDGVSFGEAVTFDGLNAKYAGVEIAPPTADQLKDTVQKYDQSGEEVRALFQDSDTHPVRLAAVHSNLETIAAGGDDIPGRLEAFTRLAGCNIYDGQEYNDGAKSTIDTLSANGVSPDNTMNLIGDVRQMQLIIDHAQSADPEKHEQSLGLLSKLAKHDIIRYLPDLVDSRQGLGGSGDSLVLSKLLEDPDQYAAYVDAVDGKVDAVAESGFPTRLAAAEVFGRFSIYRGNRYITDETAHIETTLDKQRQIGGALQPIESINPVLAGRLVSGTAALEAFDPVATASAGESLAALMQDHPEAYGLVEQQIKYASSLDEVARQLAIGDGLVTHGELLARLDERDQQSHYSESDSMSQLIARDLGGSYNSKTPEDIREAFATFERAGPILTDERIQRYDQVLRALARQYKTDEIIDTFTSGSVQSRLDDPFMKGAIAKATSIMVHDMSHGNYDIEQAFGTIEGIDQPEVEWLDDVIGGEVRLREKRVGDEQIGEFRQLFAEAMPRRDKDGNYYDAALSIEQAIIDTYKQQYTDGRYSPEDLAWYRGSEMPIAGYSSVALWRGEAVASGVSDTPKAVYEWIHKDPEQVAKISRANLGDYTATKLYEGDSAAASEAVAASRTELLARNDGFRVLLNLDMDAMTSIIQSGGAIKSMLDSEVDLTRDTGYDLRRSGVEVALGLRSMDSDTPHPIYGSCGFVDQEIPTGAIGYGDIMLTFKETPELAARTTYTPEDSFHGAHRLTAEDAKVLRLAKDAKGQGHMLTSEYVEAQIQGGVTLEGVDRIYVMNDEQRQALSSKLPQHLVSRVTIRPQVAA